jgi:SAM-dependent methyltransferase
MTSADHPVRRHYDTLLAPIYAWMVGDPAAAQARARDDLEPVAASGTSRVAVDLGAGLGHHARALAEAGYDDVWMIDTSADLVAAARGTVRGCPGRVHAIEGGLVAFDDHVERGSADAIVCMGDTLTHMADRDEVATLLGKVAATLRPGGVFLTTFRDYTRELEGVDRFVPVRSDDERILTVFLEYEDDVVHVHDLLFERRDDRWALQVGAYPKLRLAPSWVAGVLRDHGLIAEVDGSSGGLSRIVARRPATST